MTEQKIGELAQRIVEHWDEWEEEAGMRAQVEQDPTVWEYEMNAFVTDMIRSFAQHGQPSPTKSKSYAKE